MADLIAQGEKAEDRWRRTLDDDELLLLGRRCSGYSVPWDPQISRQHVRMRFREGRLKVDRIAEAANAVFYSGQNLDSFWMSPGEHFVIGQTKFTLVADKVFVSIKNRKPNRQQSFKQEFLREARYRDADQRVAVINQLPDVISQAGNETDLLIRLTNMLLTGIRRATSAAVVELQKSDGQVSVEVQHWDRRLLAGGDFKPSLTLIQQAIETGESVLHVWDDNQFQNDTPDGKNVTLHSEGNWAFVTPLTSSLQPPRALYIAGDSRRAEDSDSSFEVSDLRDDMKFAELVGATLANLLRVKKLEQSQAGLRSFFSPVVMEALADKDPMQVLKPRECDVSVLFCDLRGFSRTSEQMSDQLYELLDRVSQALGVTTHNILNERGVVGDFHGDAAMGFWGWPLDQADSVERACRTALMIQREFRSLARQQKHPLKDFQFGMGISTGRAVAGRIGTEDQVKVTVFGPVVNLAARLESMTRNLKAPILLDEPTGEEIRSAGSDLLKVRRLAVIRPVGMNKSATVYQLLDGQSPDCLQDSEITAYESALDHFTEGDWARAFELLHQVPAGDQAKDLLTVHIAQHNRTAPPDWDGVILIERK